jgi:AcrR family transcriptional regulator
VELTVRYAKGQKVETRKRIIEVAARRFREHGIAATGIATVMADAELTNGAFYGHFESKEHLVRETVQAEMAAQVAAWRLTLRSGGLEFALRTYLSTLHRDMHGTGCTSAPLLAEIGRQPTATRSAYAAQLEESIDLFADYLPARDAAIKRSTAVAIIALLAGTLQMARVIPDEAVSAEILENGVQAALKLARARR